MSFEERKFKNQEYGKKVVRRNYSKMSYDLPLPNLIEIQRNSFDDFVNEGIKRLLDDISPIESPNGLLRVYFDNPRLGENKPLPGSSKEKDASYFRPLYARGRLENTLTGEVKEAGDVLLAERLPIMTPAATFIINGAERIIVSQLVRSSGVYFMEDIDKKHGFENKFSGQIIPTRGAWIEFSEGSKEVLFAKLDRSNKVPLTTLMVAFGLKSRSAIENLFGRSKRLTETFAKDKGLFDKDANTSYVSSNREKFSPQAHAIAALYSLMRTEGVAGDSRSFLRDRLFNNRRYDLQSVGRFKFNQKLDVLNRCEGLVLAQDLEIMVDGKPEVIKQDTRITAQIIAKLKNSRESFRKEIISAADNLENLTDQEIKAYFDDAGKLVAKENIYSTKNGEIIVANKEEITADILSKLRSRRSELDDAAQRFFFNDDVLQKKEYKGVFVEMIKVHLVDPGGKVSTDTTNIIGSDFSETKEHITVSDIIASLSYYLGLYEGVGTCDDIDHLGNRRLRLIGELLTNQFRMGLAKSEKNIKDKLSTTSFDDFTFKKTINLSPLQAAIKSFFGSSQLSQFMDQINPLAELTQKRRVSALGTGGIQRDRAGVEIRDVHNSHYGRLCPIETPEGPSIGLISSLATYARVDKHGFIMTPFYKVVKQDGKVKVTNEFIYLAAYEEANEIIASAASKLDDNNVFAEKEVIARFNGETKFVSSDRVTLMDVSPKQLVSVATATIPFLENDDASRALMGANMQRQAVPLLQATSPIVGTGIEYRAAKDAGTIVVAQEDGYVVHVEATKIITLNITKDLVTLDGQTIGSNADFNPQTAYKLYREHANDIKSGVADGASIKEYNLHGFDRSNQNTLLAQRPIVIFGEYVQEGDVIADGPSTQNGELALGRNVTVAFMTWDGYNYEDAIVMSEDLVKHDIFTSVHIDKFEVETRELKQSTGKEKFTNDLSTVGVSKGQISRLDELGAIAVGTVVKEDDILVGKVTPRGQFDQSPVDKITQAIFGEKSRDLRDSSLRVPHGDGGVVQSVQYFSKDRGDKLGTDVNELIRVFVAQKRKITEGDKMAGRHGNKGVISKILPREDMPYLEDGTPIDIMLNPLGVPSRMNIGQILEIHLGLSAEKLGIKVATPVFDGVNDADLRAIMAEAGVSKTGKTKLYDGRTGVEFDKDISVGVMYMVKLSHMVDDKLHARNNGPYTLVTQQPMGGKAQNGGQRFGEMEVWALYAYGAAHTLQELLTIKSDDMHGRNKAYNAIAGFAKEFPTASIPESFRVLMRELQSLGLYVELVDAKDGSNEATKSLFDNSRRGTFGHEKV